HMCEDHRDDIPVRHVLCLIPASDGGVFAVSTDRIWHFRADSPPAVIGASPPGVTFSNVEDSLSEDAAGALWIGTCDHGGARLQQGRVETIPDADVRDRSVVKVFVDREGTIWAGATSGLHRFRKPMVQAMPNVFRHLTGVPGFVFVDSRDNVWIAPGDKVGA